MTPTSIAARPHSGGSSWRVGMRYMALGKKGNIGRASAGDKSKSGQPTRAAEAYLDLLIAADAGGIAALFADRPCVDQPLWGPAQNVPELFAMVARAGGWLAERHATVRNEVTTRTGERVVAEQVLCLTMDQKPIEVPVAVVTDIGARGIVALRTYHSTWPLTREHAIRAPLLSPDPSLVAPDVIDDYQRALAVGDLEKILAAFEDDGYLREPSGGEYLFRGKARLREIYSLMFANEGGIPLDHCTITDDGVRCAIEYTCARWGKTSIAPQAGIAVYERGTSGRLAAARVYDDVDPPHP